METKRFIHAAVEFKASGDTGEFEGYASIYGNVDSGNDIIQAGAFDEFKTTNSGKVRIADSHNLNRLVGLADVTSDSKGLHVRGKINTAISYAKDVFLLMKDGSYNAMSIGYSVKNAAYEEIDGESVRRIKSATLWEVSVLPFGMNEQALITDVKSDPRMFEQHLRTSMGLSQREAKTLTAAFFSGRDGQDEDAVMVEALKGFDNALTSIFNK